MDRLKPTCRRAGLRAATWLVAALMGLELPLLADGQASANWPGRRLTGRSVTIWTDLPSSPAVDELPAIFDLAVPQWAAYFGVPIARTEGWHVDLYLMQDAERFRRSGKLPETLPPFLHGYQRGLECWVRDQPSDYFRRHLVLHEGTHAFVRSFLGQGGAAWYFEGIAELLATHRWVDGQLTLKHFPASREEVPHWGRIKLLRDAVDADQVPRLQQVLNTDLIQFRQVAPYAWAWAAACLLDQYPVTSQPFRTLASQLDLSDESFNRLVWPASVEEQNRLELAWQLMIDQIDYGYSVPEEWIRWRDERPMAGRLTQSIDSAQGWQSTGIRLQPGDAMRIIARGRFQMDQVPGVWWVEPNGVTLRYHRGRPAGMLLAAICDPAVGADKGLLTPIAIGDRATLVADRAGLLWFRINEPAGLRGDNRGEITVSMEPVRRPD